MEKGKGIPVVLGLFAVSLFLLLPCRAPAQEADTVTVSGEVVDVGENNVTVDMNGANVTVQLDENVENDMDGDELMEDAAAGNETDLEPGEVVEIETEIVPGRGLWARRVRRALRPDIVWDGAVTYDANAGTISFASIEAQILSREEGDLITTQVIGSGGGNASIEDLDLSTVRVRVGYDVDGDYFVKRIVQGPVLTVRGRISAMGDHTITVNGLEIQMNENTRVRHFRPLFRSHPLPPEALHEDLPVRVLAQYIDGEYTALVVLVVSPRRVHLRGLISEIRDDGTAVLQTPGGIPFTVHVPQGRGLRLGQRVDLRGSWGPGFSIDAESLTEPWSPPEEPLFQPRPMRMRPRLHR